MKGNAPSIPPPFGLHIWLLTSHTGRNVGQQCTLSSQQVAPGVGQQPQPLAGSFDPGSWQQVLLKGQAALVPTLVVVLMPVDRVS
eukprot:COSAG05_NODE_255_length_12816_cov_13.781631_6_plen_85_part_00